MIAKSPIFLLQKLLGWSVDTYSVVFNNEREPHPLSTESVKQFLTWGEGGRGLFRKKRQASIIEGDFVKKLPYQMYLKNFSKRVSFYKNGPANGVGGLCNFV